MNNYSIEDAAKLLWQLIDLGLVLNFRYKDSGIIVKTNNKVAIRLPKIVEVANDWKEFPYLTKVQQAALQWLVDGTREVVTMVNYYIEQKIKEESLPLGESDKGEVFVKLLGDHLMIAYPNELIVIEN